MERRTLRLPGFLMLLVELGIIAATVWYAIDQDRAAQPGSDNRIGIVVAIAALVFVLIASGFMVISPNEARVVQFFGRYIGSVRRPGSTGCSPHHQAQGVPSSPQL